MSFHFGRDSYTFSNGSGADGNKYWSGWTCPSEGYVVSLHAFLSSVAAGDVNCRLGVYGPGPVADVSLPLFCQGGDYFTVPQGAPPGWYSVQVAGLPMVVYNDRYYIAVLMGGAVAAHRTTTDGVGGRGTNVYGSGFTATMADIDSTNTYNYCFYANCIEKQSLAGELITVGLLTADFQRSEYLHAYPTSDGILTAALRVGGQLSASPITYAEAEAYLRAGLRLVGELNQVTLLDAILRNSGRFWGTAPRHVYVCPRCGVQQVDGLVTRCRSCGFPLGQRL